MFNLYGYKMYACCLFFGEKKKKKKKKKAAFNIDISKIPFASRVTGP